MAAFRKHGTASKTGSFLLSHSEPHHPSCSCDDGCSWKLQRKVWEECE